MAYVCYLDSSEEVSTVQNKLVQQGYEISQKELETHTIGVTSERALSSFQSDNNISETQNGKSYAGEQTMALLSSNNTYTMSAITRAPVYVRESSLVSGSSVSSLFITNYLTKQYIYLLVRPEDVNDEIRAVFDEESVRGRSAEFVGYNHTSNRRVNFSIVVQMDNIASEELQGKTPTDAMISVVNKLKALEYPDYKAGKVIPPSCYVSVYKGIKFTAVCDSVSVNWKGPIKNGVMTMAEVSLSFVGVRGIPLNVGEVSTSGN